MKHRIGKHLNTRRYEIEGELAHKAGDRAPDAIDLAWIRHGIKALKNPCPYTRWWKVRAWWRGLFKARRRDVQQIFYSPHSFSDAINLSNTYVGQERNVAPMANQFWTGHAGSSDGVTSLVSFLDDVVYDADLPKCAWVTDAVYEKYKDEMGPHTRDADGIVHFLPDPAVAV